MSRGQPLVCSRSDPGPVRGGGGAARRKAPLSGQALPPVAVRGVGHSGPARPPARRPAGPHPGARRAGGAGGGQAPGGTPPVLRSHRSLRRNGGAGPGAPLPLRPARAGEHHRRALLRLRRRGAPAGSVVFPVLRAPARCHPAGPLPRPGGAGPGGGRSGAVRPEGPPAGSGAARAGERLRLRPPAPGAGAPRPAGGRQGAPPRAAPPPSWRRVGRGGGVRPAVPALVQPTDLVLLRPDAERLRGPLRPAGAGAAGGGGAPRLRRDSPVHGRRPVRPRPRHLLHGQRRAQHQGPHPGYRPLQALPRRDGPGLGLCGRGAGPHLPGGRQRRGGGARRNRPGRSCPGPGPAQPPHHRGRSPGHLCQGHFVRQPGLLLHGVAGAGAGTSVADRTGPLPGGGAGGLPFLDSGVPLAPPRLAGGVVGNEPPA